MSPADMKSGGGGGSVDVEAGKKGALYASKTDNQSRRWALIRKVYSILAMQLILTTTVSAVFVFVHPIPTSFFEGFRGIIFMLIIFLVPLAVMLPMHRYRTKHPQNLYLLMLFTATSSVAVGISCQLRPGRIVLEAGFLTCAATVALTLYTFWADKRGHEFEFFGPFSCAAFTMLTVFCLIPLIFPLEKVWVMAMGCVGALIFSAFIVYDTDNLIERFKLDGYIAAAVALYLDMLNLFVPLMNIMGGCK